MLGQPFKAIVVTLDSVGRINKQHFFMLLKDFTVKTKKQGRPTFL
jgi:hypothetical protein